MTSFISRTCHVYGSHMHASREPHEFLFFVSSEVAWVKEDSVKGWAEAGNRGTFASNTLAVLFRLFSRDANKATLWSLIPGLFSPAITRTRSPLGKYRLILCRTILEPLRILDKIREFRICKEFFQLQNSSCKDPREIISYTKKMFLSWINVRN